MPLRGDFAKLSLLAKELRAFGENALGETATEMQKVAVGLVDRSFQQRRSPDGQAWAPLKKGGPSTLDQTGALRAAVTGPGGVDVTRRRVRLSADSPPYAAVHQLGSAAKNIPARPFLPAANSLPNTWAVELASASVRAIDKAARRLPR